jgi:glyoxylase-like metal-dependent hydrolase (beta-lactamase superfamily II)
MSYSLKVLPFAELQRHGLRPNDINMLITSHGHPDHIGNDYMFRNATHYFFVFSYNSNVYTLDELVQNVTLITDDKMLYDEI